MLRGIHKASANWLGRVVMGLVLGLIAISFGIWGIGDIFRGFGQSTLATIGGTDLRIDAFRQIYQDRVQQLSRQAGRPILPEQARALGLDRQVLTQVIAETVLDDRAKSLRLGVSEGEIARRITENPNFQGLTGQFDRMRFEQAIRANGFTEARYISEQRRAALRRQLLTAVSGDVAPPKAALEAFVRYQGEQRSIEYAVIGRAQAGNIPDPAPDVLTKYFQDQKVLFRTPEYRKIQMIVLTPAEVAPSVEISDEDVKKAFEDRRARYQTPERRKIQQISFPSVAEARAAAEKIAAGATFESIATERGLKDSDIELGLLAKSALVDKAVADAAFSLQTGKVSAPVEGRFGASLVRVTAIEPGATRTFEQIAPELKKDLANERAKNLLSGIHDKVEDERLSGTPLSDIAKKFDLKIQTIDAVDRNGRAPDGAAVQGLPAGVDLLRSAFTADLGGDNDPLSMPAGGGYVWFDVVDIKPAREQTLDEIKDKVIARWRDEEIASRLKTKGTALYDKIKAGADFKQVLAGEKLSVSTATGIKRDAPPAPIPARAVEGIFRTAKGDVGVIDSADGVERIVYRVTDVVVPPFNADAEDVKKLDEGLRRALTEQLIEQYVARLEQEIGVRINQNALSQITGSANN